MNHHYLSILIERLKSLTELNCISDLAKNKKKMSPEMAEFCRLKTCRRKYLMEYCGHPLTEDEQDCCDNCDRIRASADEIDSEPSPKRMRMTVTDDEVMLQCEENSQT